MKKLIITLFLFFPFLSFAQVEFNGIRVGESLEITKKNLQDKGFTQKLTQNNLIEWEGLILGKTAKIYTISTPISNFVWKILVVPETHMDWSSTKFAVEKYIKILSEKYGKPKNEYFFFKEPYFEGDGHEMMALKLKKILCSYFWELPGGTIWLEPFSIKYGEAQIRINYEDSAAVELKKEESSKIEQKTF